MNVEEYWLCGRTALRGRHQAAINTRLLIPQPTRSEEFSGLHGTRNGIPLLLSSRGPLWSARENDEQWVNSIAIDAIMAFFGISYYVAVSFSSVPLLQLPCFPPNAFPVYRPVSSDLACVELFF